MQTLNLTPDYSSKPDDAVLGVRMSLSNIPTVDYKLLRSMPSLGKIRKDNYQAWLYEEDYPNDWMYGKFLSLMQSTDLSGNPNCYPGFVCGTAPIVGNSEYFWQDRVERMNSLLMQECGSPCYSEESVGAVSTDIRVPVDFLVVSFDKLDKKHTLLYNGTELLTLAMGRRKWSESTLPTLFLQFAGDTCTSIEICDVHDEVSHIDFTLDTDIPVTYNRVKSSVR